MSHALIPEAQQASSFFRGLSDAHRGGIRRMTRRRDGRVFQTSVFNECCAGQMADLYMFITDTPEGPICVCGDTFALSPPHGHEGIVNRRTDAML